MSPKVLFIGCPIIFWHPFSYSASVTPIDKRGVAIELQESLLESVKEQNIDLPSGDY